MTTKYAPMWDVWDIDIINIYNTPIKESGAVCEESLNVVAERSHRQRDTFHLENEIVSKRMGKFNNLYLSDIAVSRHRSCTPLIPGWFYTDDI